MKSVHDANPQTTRGVAGGFKSHILHHADTGRARRMIKLNVCYVNRRKEDTYMRRDLIKGGTHYEEAGQEGGESLLDIDEISEAMRALVNPCCYFRVVMHT